MVRRGRGKPSVGELRRKSETAPTCSGRDAGRARVTQVYAAGELEDYRLMAGERCASSVG